MTDPLLSHLLDIVSEPAADGLILGGGFRYPDQANRSTRHERTLIPVIPEARATQDLDFFLSLSVFVRKESGSAVRTLIDRLGYTEYTRKYQFGKPLDAQHPDIRAKVDLLAWLPNAK